MNIEKEFDELTKRYKGNDHGKMSEYLKNVLNDKDKNFFIKN